MALATQLLGWHALAINMGLSARLAQEARAKLASGNKIMAGWFFIFLFGFKLGKIIIIDLIVGLRDYIHKNSWPTENVKYEWE